MTRYGVSNVYFWFLFWVSVEADNVEHCFWKPFKKIALKGAFFINRLALQYFIPWCFRILKQRLVRLLRKKCHICICFDKYVIFVHVSGHWRLKSAKLLWVQWSPTPLLSRSFWTWWVLTLKALQSLSAEAVESFTKKGRNLRAVFPCTWILSNE